MAIQSDQQYKSPEAPAEGRAPDQIILRMASAPRVTRASSLRLLLLRFLFPPARIPGWKGYTAAVLGVALASGLIELIGQVIHIGNISLIYLPVVLWLATAFGRGPALLASVLAFLEYDFLFIPPLYRFTVDDPTEWVSLFALLITALVLGQLTAVVQEHAREVRESQQRTATLYALAQLIASASDQQALLDALAQRVLHVFAPAGVRACALFLPDAYKRPVLRAKAASAGLEHATLELEQREHFALAVWALTNGSPVGHSVHLDEASSASSQKEYSLIYVPLQSRREVVGVLGIIGTVEMQRLVSRVARATERTSSRGAIATNQQNAEAAFFSAFCDQIALALERAALQQQVIHAEALRESNHLKDVLLGSVSHELRTPLASIQAAASSLLEPGVQWSEAEQRELLESITGSSARLNRLVSNLLDLSRLEAGVSAPQKDWHFIGEVVATVLDRLDLAGQGQDHHIQVEIPDNMTLVPMDHEQVEQVLTNLLENALKYSPTGSAIRVQADVKLGPEGGKELEVRVADQGIGIPAAELKTIFDKFYRVQQVRLPWAKTRPPTGTGLGLAICATIIQAHGGRIWAESQQGQGATFIFTLPIPDDGPEAAILPLEEQPAHQPPLAPEVNVS
ncbi:MAG TPA: ATP-binding protein [Ktedonobacterales bacterium]|nr:ATP-binding protein [Ktedonobacterales bacterium]